MHRDGRQLSGPRAGGQEGPEEREGLLQGVGFLSGATKTLWDQCAGRTTL